MQCLSLYMCRHASVDRLDDVRFYYEPPGPSLNATGVEEAERLGEFLTTLRIDLAFSSPMRRCLDTALIVSHRTKLQFSSEAGLTEQRLDEDSDKLYSRMKRTLDGLLVSCEDHAAVLLITHGGPIASLLLMTGMPEDELVEWQKRFDHGNPAPPAGVWKTVVRMDSGFRKPRLVFTPYPY